MPLNVSLVRVGRTKRVGGGRLSGLRRDRGERNSRRRDSSPVIAVRAAAIASGEKYPKLGMCKRESVTRPLADKSSFGISGNGMLLNSSSRRRGADLPKNESGRTGTQFLSQKSTETSRLVNSGNGFRIAAANLSQRKLVISEM